MPLSVTLITNVERILLSFCVANDIKLFQMQYNKKESVGSVKLDQSIPHFYPPASSLLLSVKQTNKTLLTSNL